MHFSVPGYSDNITAVQLEEKLESLAAQDSLDKMVDWGLFILSTNHAENEAKILNGLSGRVHETGDKKLINLFRRAVKNHDSIYTGYRAEPVTSYYEDYSKPSFKIPEIALTLEILDDLVKVTTTLQISQKEENSKIVLDGQGHVVKEVVLNNKVLSPTEWVSTQNELIILTDPLYSECVVTIKSEIDPFTNESLEGMYKTGDWLISQCESEGARRIFFTLDRPDVLSRITTTIIARPEKYSSRLSNGNLIAEKKLEDGRSLITWDDPFPKPSYLFACVLGNFALLEDKFTTRSKLEVKLQIFVERGKENRAEYAMHVLKQAMEFDEEYFDREYDLDCLKIVGVPDFNAGAMENKGLLVFNDKVLLVDEKTGADSDFRRVAHVIFHEYAHNWSGNRVTVRNWFEIALKEAFTDFRSHLFTEWLFGGEFSRLEQIRTLREDQYIEDASKMAHPIQVESYVSSHSIYDSTTYVKGAEVFRMLKTILDSLGSNKFRQALNAYFERYDGKAVTFNHLLKTIQDVSKVDLTVFSEWFHQAGTPKVTMSMDYDPEDKEVVIKIKQECKSPLTGENQKPFHLPVYIELLGQDGKPVLPKTLFNLEGEEKIIVMDDIVEKPIPVFLHGLSAPVTMDYPYSDDELKIIMINETDPFASIEAGQIYSKRQILKIFNSDLDLENIEIPKEVVETYQRMLFSRNLSPLKKAKLLEFSSIRAIVQEMPVYDFNKAARAISIFQNKLAASLEEQLLRLLEDNQMTGKSDPASPNFISDMKIRYLRNRVLEMLYNFNKEHYLVDMLQTYKVAVNFNDKKFSLYALADSSDSRRDEIFDNFYRNWKNDKLVFNDWIRAQTVAKGCRVEYLERIEKTDGFSAKNPNHIRSLIRSFVNNLDAYHDLEGKGYQYVTKKIIEISKFNSHLATNYLAKEAYQDFAKLPKAQKDFMAIELNRILDDKSLDSGLRDLAKKTLGES